MGGVKEKEYFSLLNPEYNILKDSFSSLGYKHTKESKLKINMANKGKKRSEEFKKMASAILKGVKKSKDTIEKMRKANLGKKHKIEGRTARVRA